MIYNKFIKKSNKSSLLVILCSILLFVGIFYFCIRGTRAYFGNDSNVVYSVTFYTNYPEDSSLENVYTMYWIYVNTVCEIGENQFDIPLGYEFAGWNSKSDGSGFTFDKTFVVTEEVSLYAMWSKIEVDDSTDVDEPSNEEEIPDLDDTEEELPKDEGNDDIPSNEDNNVSTEDNNTEVGDDTSNDEDDNISDNEENTTDSDVSEDGDINVGTGELGSGGTSNSGNGSSNNSNSSSSNSSNNSGNNNSNNKDKETNKNDEEEKKEDIFYVFKYMNDNVLYNETVCKVSNNGDSCKLLLPGINPFKDGYTFTGWSLDKDCNSKSIITKSIDVNSSNTYYACYVKNSDEKSSLDHFSVIISIITMWGVTITAIVLTIIRFIKNNRNN